MSQKKKRDPEATRAAILESAEKLFIEKGLAGVAVSAIALQAGVTKSLIHHHFGSKENLWSAVKQHMFDGYAAEQSNLLDTGTTNDLLLLRQSVEAYFKFLKGNPAFVRLSSWATLEGEGCHLQEELISWGARRIEESQAKGIVRNDINPTHVIIAFLSLAQQWFAWKGHWDLEKIPTLTGSEKVVDEAYLESIMKILIDGIRI